MLKENYFNDDDYCKLFAMCMSYKCKYSVQTFTSEIAMAEHVMETTESFVAPISKIEVKVDDN
jgi:hypothetical protein